MPKTTTRSRVSDNRKFAANDTQPSKTRRRRLTRHVVVAASSASLVGIFWATRSNWESEMRLWKAVGDASFMLLLAALAAGPIARLMPSARGLLRWRRQLGIWFALTATVHGVLILDGWARWSLRRFLGYEFIPQLGREARIEPGFGLANLVGSVALVLALILGATSSDWAMRRLGRKSWAWLHRLAHTVLVLSLLHGSYFLFMHYTESFHKRTPPELDWFRMPFLLIGLAVIGLQFLAFARDWQAVEHR
ncbi:MAG: ferric reductase-like transmembrane domain-containing protein [Acidimicrobiia bacterium]|nr:ferric reductase-like transmembrane domain-containing protein [Acidimicrobiia bacterium]